MAGEGFLVNMLCAIWAFVLLEGPLQRVLQLLHTHASTLTGGGRRRLRHIRGCASYHNACHAVLVFGRRFLVWPAPQEAEELATELLAGPSRRQLRAGGSAWLVIPVVVMLHSLYLGHAPLD